MFLQFHDNRRGRVLVKSNQNNIRFIVEADDRVFFTSIVDAHPGNNLLLRDGSSLLLLRDGSSALLLGY